MTSPPYYGLRDYGIAKWEGGDADCDHRYREDQRDPTSTLHGPSNAEGYALNHYKDICKQCGAKRIDAQLGLEPTLQEYIDSTVAWCAQVWRVLRDDGTFWLNLGDSYSGNNFRASSGGRAGYGTPREGVFERGASDGFKKKDLMLVPHRVAIALQNWGWHVRSDIVWHKSNPMPESVTDRPTKSHEYVFLLTKSGKSQYWTHPNKRGCREQPDPDYYWVHKETELIVDYPPVSKLTLKKFWKRRNRWKGHDYFYDGDAIREKYATFPTKLPETCIKAGTSEKGVCPVCGNQWERVVENKPGKAKLTPKTISAHHARGGNGIPTGTVGKAGSSRIDAERITTGWNPTCSHNEKPIPATVLDLFGGSGTTAMVANRLGRIGISLDLSWEYLQLAKERTGAKAIAEWESGKGEVESNLDGLPIFELLKGDQEK